MQLSPGKSVSCPRNQEINDGGESHRLWLCKEEKNQKENEASRVPAITFWFFQPTHEEEQKRIVKKEIRKNEPAGNNNEPSADPFVCSDIVVKLVCEEYS